MLPLLSEDLCETVTQLPPAHQGRPPAAPKAWHCGHRFTGTASVAEHSGQRWTTRPNELAAGLLGALDALLVLGLMSEHALAALSRGADLEAKSPMAVVVAKHASRDRLRPRFDDCEATLGFLDLMPKFGESDATLGFLDLSLSRPGAVPGLLGTDGISSTEIMAPWPLGVIPAAPSPTQEDCPAQWAPGLGHTGGPLAGEPPSLLPQGTWDGRARHRSGFKI